MARVALVTGGMGGIGTAICRRFHEMGYTVIPSCSYVERYMERHQRRAAKI